MKKLLLGAISALFLFTLVPMTQAEAAVPACKQWERRTGKRCIKWRTGYRTNCQAWSKTWRRVCTRYTKKWACLKRVGKRRCIKRRGLRCIRWRRAACVKFAKYRRCAVGGWRYKAINRCTRWRSGYRGFCSRWAVKTRWICTRR